MTTQVPKQLFIRLSGFCGILGGIVLFAGDLLFYYNGDETNLIKNMALSSDDRIIYSAITALMASWFYMLGMYSIAFAVQKSKNWIKKIIVWGMSAILIAYGVVHGAYVAIATSAKIAFQNNLEFNTTTLLASKANNAIRNMVYPILGIVTIFFFIEVLRGKTRYPKWIVLFFPTVLFLIQPFITKPLSGPLWTIISGGYLNLIMVVFFAASLIALWNKKG